MFKNALWPRSRLTADSLLRGGVEPHLPPTPNRARLGAQQPGSTEITKTGEGEVSAYWLEHFKKRYPDPDYDSDSMHDHPDYKRAIEQLKAGKPPEGPWRHIVPRD